jgi:hypothetical protein
MALSDIVTVSVSSESVQIERAGFGVPLVLAADCNGGSHTGFTERVRFYTDMTGVAVDFDSTMATYKMCAKVFAQNPKLPRLAVGRLTNKPTQSWTITPIAANSTEYALYINGTRYTVTSDSDATATEIVTALKAAFAVSGLTEGGTVTLTLTASTAGVTYGIKAENTARLKVVQDQADPGLATDLDAIKAENNTWYALLNPFNSKACAKAVSDWAESNKKLFICATQDSDVVNLADGSDTGGSQTIAGQLKGANYRTALIYHGDNWEFADAAWAAALLTTDPGSENWALKALTGVTSAELTSTQRTNALTKYANVYETVAGRGATNEGKVSGNEWIDVIRFRDWLDARLGEEVFAALAGAKKIPYTDAGIAAIEGIVRGVLKQGVAAGGLSNDPAPKVTAPKAKDVSSAIKATRRLSLKFDATLAGAINAVSISGVISA